MTARRHLPGPRPLLAGALVLLLAALWTDRGSVERANRLHRAGEPTRAIELYQDRADSTRPELLYNLGTAWLGAGSPVEAEPRLTAVVEGAPGAPPGAVPIAERAVAHTEVRARGAYNLGTLLLGEGSAIDDPVMAAQLVGEAVLALRDALRADPTLDDARWNLGIAMKALDSLTAAAPGTRTGIPTRADAAGLERPDRELAGALEESGEAALLEGGVAADRARDPSAAIGSQETAASADEIGARTPEQVRSVLATVSDDVSAMLRRVLWFLGPRDPLGERSRRTGEW